MQINTEFTSGSGLTPTEAARRAQIITATVRTVAEHGYDRTSFSRIVAGAGLSSTRLISYHFADKTELMTATLVACVTAKDEFLAGRGDPGTDRRAILRAMIEGEVAFLGAEPDVVRATLEIGAKARDGAGLPLDQVARYAREGRIASQLRQGAREGVFRECDAELVALAVAQGIDGVARAYDRDPALDLPRYGRELADLFERAVAA